MPKQVNRGVPKIRWNFKVAAADKPIIDAIVKRACAAAQEAGWSYDRMDATMDIIGCHLNACPLDLPKLAKADDFNFFHDVFGIRRHLNRITGELDNFFSPRCSA